MWSIFNLQKKFSAMELHKNTWIISTKLFTLLIQKSKPKWFWSIGKTDSKCQYNSPVCFKLQVANMVEECKWTDKFVELQLWTQLTSLSYDQKQHNLVVRCSKKALRFASGGTQPKTKKIDGYVAMLDCPVLFKTYILGAKTLA